MTGSTTTATDLLTIALFAMAAELVEGAVA